MRDGVHHRGTEDTEQRIISNYGKHEGDGSGAAGSGGLLKPLWRLEKRTSVVKRKWSTRAAILLLGLSALLVWIFWSPFKLAPKLETTSWYGFQDLWLRYLEPGGDDILMAHWSTVEWDVYGRNGPPDDAIPIQDVYVFHAKANQAEKVAPDFWLKGKGAVVRCSKRPDKVANWDPRKCELPGINSTGRSVIQAKLAPSKRTFAVLSAAGRVWGSLFGLGGGTPFGPYYHQQFDNSTMEQIGPTLQLGTNGERLISEPLVCWMDDERHFIYYDSSDGQYLWVIASSEE